ncbi:MAG: hypothetical protein VX674_02855, partial [Pseudomonadota bacterium]|nr:hypothetical protein [Pseudomonadota bacterium]
MKFKEYLIYFLLKILNSLPRKLQLLLGKFFGFVLFLLSKKRKEIARWNLEKCFPEKDSIEINLILKASFFRLGEALFEFLNAFWMSDRKLKKLIVNFDNVEKVCFDMDSSKGKLLLFMHNPNL